MANKESKNKILVRQYRSTAASDKRVRATLQSIGLGRIGKQTELPNDAATKGKLIKLNHLVEIVN